MSPFNSHLLLYGSVLGGQDSSSLAKFFSVLMNACMVMVNNVLVVGATEICITVTIIGEAFL